MKNSRTHRVTFGVLSVGTMIVVYTLISNAYQRPGVLPPIQVLLAAVRDLVTGQERDATLQGALLVSTLRVLFGVGVGGALGILVGLWMGWSRKADEYLHPIYVLLRSIPPLALITYVMLWFGHGEAHRLIPVVYAVFTTLVIPTYHGVRDVADVYVKAARSLGAGRGLLLSKIVLPGASPFVLSGLRYALIIAWMTTVGVEMLMSDDGVGHLVVGGGLWASRSEIRVNPAAVMVSILGVATVGFAMDTVARTVIDSLTFWARGRR